LYSLII